MKTTISRQAAIVVATLVTAIALVVLGGWYVLQYHHGVQESLDQLEPRYARLVGLEAQQAEIETLKVKAAALREQYVYPAAQDATQTGNQAQQKVRDILAAAGLQVISSQVLPAKDEKGFDRIPLTLRAEGELLGLQSALAVINSQQPVIIINDLDVQVQGGIANHTPKTIPKLTIQFNLSVLREQA